MLDWSERVTAGEAKKAGSASEVPNRIPSPPALMGSEAWSHWSSDKERLRTLHRPSRRAESNLGDPGGQRTGSNARGVDVLKSSVSISVRLMRRAWRCYPACPRRAKAQGTVLPRQYSALSMKKAGHPKE